MALTLSAAMFSTTIMMSSTVDQSYQEHTYNLVLDMNNAVNAKDGSLASSGYGQIKTLEANGWRATNGKAGCTCNSDTTCGAKPVFCGALAFYLGILEGKCVTNFNMACGDLTSTRLLKSDDKDFWLAPVSTGSLL